MSKTIYFNGTIIPVDDSINEPEALLIENDKILKIGKYDEVIKHKDDNTKLVDLNKKTLMPSFIDPHGHITFVAQEVLSVNLAGAKNFKEIGERLLNFKKQHANKLGKVIYGVNYDHNFLEEKRHPDLRFIDSVISDYPVFLQHVSVHMGSMNSLTAKMLGFNKDSKFEGGIVELYDDGEFDGVVYEAAFMQALKLCPMPDNQQLVDALEQAQQNYVKHGITTAQEGLMRNTLEIPVLTNAVKQKKLVIDVVGYLHVAETYALSVWKEHENDFVKGYVNHFRLDGFKLVGDGSPQGRTAYMSKPYLHNKENNEPDDYRSNPIWTQEQMDSYIKQVYELKNATLIVHTNGDGTSDMLIKGWQKVLKEHHKNKIDHRAVMIHAQTVRHDQLEIMKEINLIPSFFVAHVYHWGDIHINNFGMERAQNISPAGWALKLGIMFTFHQDSPVIPPDMFETIWAAVNRVTRNGVFLNPKEQSVNPYEAIKAVTINAAKQYGEDQHKGSLTPGKYADFIIVDKNPLTTPKMELNNIKVHQTFFHGKKLFELVDGKEKYYFN